MERAGRGRQQPDAVKRNWACLLLVYLVCRAERAAGAAVLAGCRAAGEGGAGHGARGAASQAGVVEHAVAVLVLQRAGHRQRGHGGVAAGDGKQGHGRQRW